MYLLLYHYDRDKGTNIHVHRDQFGKLNHASVLGALPSGKGARSDDTLSTLSNGCALVA